MNVSKILLTFVSFLYTIYWISKYYIPKKIMSEESLLYLLIIAIIMFRCCHCCPHVIIYLTYLPNFFNPWHHIPHIVLLHILRRKGEGPGPNVWWSFLRVRSKTSQCWLKQSCVMRDKIWVFFWQGINYQSLMSCLRLFRSYHKPAYLAML